MKDENMLFMVRLLDEFKPRSIKEENLRDSCAYELIMEMKIRTMHRQLDKKVMEAKRGVL